MALAVSLPNRNKHQERTEATQAKLLVAAQEVFTRDGFANARLEQIAAEAGYTRGAIYAHYKSKEDLFLALFEQRMRMVIAEIAALIERFDRPEDRLRHFRSMLVRKSSDRSWAILVLEFKLFALRQPKLKARLQRNLAMLHATSKSDFLHALFGELKPKAQREVERRLALLGTIMTAAVLESHFHPDTLSGKDLDTALGELIDAIVRV